MAMQQGAGFRVVGSVVRKFVVNSGKVAFLTLDVTTANKSRKHDFKTFDCVDDVASLADGAIVEVTGNLDVEKLTAKDRSDVMVDGRTKWIPSLVIKAIKTEGLSVAAKPKHTTVKAPMSRPPAEPVDPSDDCPF